MSRVIQWFRDLFKNQEPTPGRPGSMSLDERRKLYACGNGYKTFADIPCWKDYYELHKERLEPLARDIRALAPPDDDLNQIVGILHGDITSLEIDCIVNPANDTLLGGSGIDGAVHKAAGPKLRAKCRTLNGCRTGDSKLTSGFNLPANYIIHTVVPRTKNPVHLQSCYEKSLALAAQKCFRVVAFPSLACGKYGYAIEESSPIAVTSLRSLLANREDFARVIFCMNDIDDLKVYETAMLMYFPMPGADEGHLPQW